ncbi:hypothetical protein AA102526_2623 [Asaia lannensis NBRC 102526]|nr:hypothetical protein AA102526_2623 [Asaia lannensis NBRC 102526]
MQKARLSRTIRMLEFCAKAAQMHFLSRHGHRTGRIDFKIIAGFEERAYATLEQGTTLQKRQPV